MSVMRMLASADRSALDARLVRLISAIAAAAVIVGSGQTAVLSQTLEQQWSIDKLGPDAFLGIPPTLGVLVDGSDAAVVGRIIGTGGVTFHQFDNPYSEKKTIFGYATYRISITDVLFTRNPANAPSLIEGTEMNFGQEVGREAARRFVARQIPVREGDECLLFLMARPHGWTLLKWHVQFRRTDGPAATAENLGGGNFAAAVTPAWLGTSVRTAPKGDRIGADWSSLLGEVRRLGAIPAKLRPR